MGKSKKCKEVGCEIDAHYNKEGETKSIYCSTHKLTNMVNIMDKTCIEPNCKTRPTYNHQRKIG